MLDKWNEIDFKIQSTIDGCRHFDSISIPIITWCLNITTPQNKRDKPGSSYSVDMVCQAYGCLTRQWYGKILFRFPDPVKRKEFYMTWLTNLNIEETSFTSTKRKLVCEDHFETSCFEGNLMIILFIFLIILNIWIYYTTLLADLRFVSIDMHMAKQTNRGKRSVFNETHLQKIFFENWRTTKLCEKKERTLEQCHEFVKKSK